MKKFVIVIFEIVLFLAVVTAGINLYMVKTTEKNIVEITDLKDDYDAILVLGCKVEDGYPSVMLEKRLDKGIEVYNKLNTKLLLSGDHGEKEYDEVNVMNQYMLDKNIDSSDIFLDHAGFSTYDSIYRAKYVYGVKKMVIVTQRFHLFRALYIAEKLGIEAVGIKAEDVIETMVMVKNEMREVLSRDKNFIKTIIKPESKYVGEKISLDGDSSVTAG